MYTKVYLFTSRHLPGILVRIRMITSSTYNEIVNAQGMGFSRRAATSSAKSLIKEITESILTSEVRTRRRREVNHDKFLLGVEVILADLLMAYVAKSSSWAYRSLFRQSFVGEVIGADTFNNIMKQLQKLRYVQHHKGGNLKNPFHEGASSRPFYPGLASRFRATEKLIERANEHGLSTDSMSANFASELPKRVLKLKALSWANGRNKVRGKTIQIKWTPELKEVSQRIKRINRYLSEQSLENGNFNGYHRVFNEGDHPDFKWNMGGRLYGVGEESYQQMKKKNRRLMLINGEPVVEIDINGSFLRILHSLLGEQLKDKDDIYAITGINRSLIKSWVTATLGHTGFHKRWPVKLSEQLKEKGVFEEKQYTMTEIEQIVLKEFSVLVNWPSSGVRSSHLMFEESEAMLNTVESLINEDIPAYSVHDSLIVGEKHRDTATKTLTGTFESHFGVAFQVT